MKYLLVFILSSLSFLSFGEEPTCEKPTQEISIFEYSARSDSSKYNALLTGGRWQKVQRDRFGENFIQIHDMIEDPQSVYSVMNIKDNDYIYGTENIKFSSLSKVTSAFLRILNGESKCLYIKNENEEVLVYRYSLKEL